ncbi:MAG TPA: DUF547 domain-containing protein [Parvularcula sp.]|nr:DUF547 domain-containing protein [Parvularcula sp.]HBS30580.1 DUF547 domain-containing protein [Parvularcula sp.]HBS34391.1 DUF547 domain-containing protein [Parvularcula sp.]
MSPVFPRAARGGMAGADKDHTQMKPLFAALALTLALPAPAAQMAVERQFAPKSVLVDPRFEASDEASPVIVDHGRWGRFLDAYVVKGPAGINLVRYKAVTAADKAMLAAYIDALAATDAAALPRKEQLALWINLYNAATVKLILDHPGIASILDIEKPWDRPVATVGVRALTLNDIEHGIIRPLAKDARVHYAVNCASMGCPNLARAPFTGAGLDAALDAAARAYVNHPRGVSVTKGKARLSKIFGWYRDDFGKDDAALIDHIRLYAEPALAARLKRVKRADSYDYDWALNAAE